MASIGALFAVSFKKIGHLTLCVLISFAAGALLAVSFLDILPEAFGMVGWFGGIVSALSGYLLFWLLTRYVFHVCPACSATHTEINFTGLTAAMVVALSVHSFMDGLAIYSGYMTGSHLGLIVLIAVAYHKLPEGMALALVARSAGMGRLKAFTLAAGLEAATTLAGGLVGMLFLLPESSRLTGYILAHTAGGFIFIVLHALLSEVIKHHPRWTILAAVVGALSIAAAGILLNPSY